MNDLLNVVFANPVLYFNIVFVVGFLWWRARKGDLERERAYREVRKWNDQKKRGSREVKEEPAGIMAFSSHAQQKPL